MVESSAEMTSTIKKLARAVSSTIPLFIIFSDTIYDRYISLPLLITYSGATVICIMLALLAFAFRRWPKQFEPYRNSIKDVLGQLSDSMFSFVMAVLVIRAFYPLDLALLPFLHNWWVWLIFFLEANLLLTLWSFKNHQDLYSKAIQFFWSTLR